MYFHYHVIFGILLSLPLTQKGLTPAIVFILGNVVMDLDHPLTFLLRGSRVYENALRTARIKGLREAMRYLMDHHKEVNNLLMHNVVSFYISLALSLTFCCMNWLIPSYFLEGVLIHSAIDQLDDVHAIRSLRNWFWPLSMDPGYKISLGTSISSLVMSIVLYIVLVLK